jgi:hypothetical protein
MEVQPIPPRFCECQVYAKGNSRKAYACKPEDPEAQRFCGAQLNAGQAFPCPYIPGEIYQEGDVWRIAHRNKKGDLVGRCEDFELIPSQDTSPPQTTQSYQEPPKTHHSGSSKNRRPKRKPHNSKPPRLGFIIKSFVLECKPSKHA